MKIIVDADGCPVTKIALAYAKDHGMDCAIVADSAHNFSPDGADVYIVDQGADSADMKILEIIVPGDIAVTQDYGLAALCLARGAYALRQDGTEYTADNIDSLLMTRHISKRLRRAGAKVRGPKKRESSADAAFSLTLEKIASRR